MGRYAGQRRQTSCASGWIKFTLLGVIVSVFFQGALCELEPTESQCRSHIEKALKEQHHEIEGKSIEGETYEVLVNGQEGLPPADELTDPTEGSITNEDKGNDNDDENAEDRDDKENENAEVSGEDKDDGDTNEDIKTEEDDTEEQNSVKAEIQNNEDEEKEDDTDKDELDEENIGVESKENDDEEDNEVSTEDQKAESDDNIGSVTHPDDTTEDEKEKATTAAFLDEGDDEQELNLETPIDIDVQEVEIDDNDDDNEGTERVEDKETEDNGEKEIEDNEEEEIGDDDDKETQDNISKNSVEEEENDKKEIGDKIDDESQTKEKQEETNGDGDYDPKELINEKDEDVGKQKEAEDEKEGEDSIDGESSDKKYDGADDDDDDDDVEEKLEKREAKLIKTKEVAETEAEEDGDQEAPEEEELINEMVIPENLRSRDHIDKILKLEDTGLEKILEKTIVATLKDLKGLYDNAIKPLEMLYKYRDLSNRHFGDPEIFSKPLILFMGPWSGGKSSTINYLLDNEFSRTSLRTGAEPSPAYFNILMHGEEEEILDGTQLAADWTFSGLQKFGQTLLDRLKGIKLPNKLLEKVNIVEIPGILEIRKQVQRLFPFNDACQWFIDRADIIFLVYDPSKLDVGPETEAILDQLKGREYQTRIILNKADQVKPEELMRVQGTLIWNISPLMSSSEPPIMYSTSLWSMPYEVGAPTRLLQAQERAFLRDLREAVDKRVENKIASARRFAVRVRNHAKMVDCYLTTYYNHKTIFGNRKKISDDIIEYPQKYHIYEGLSTLTNISRYDLPDPDAYRDFFKINPLYDFKKLSETCTYFRGCPINKLDVAIAYDLPELVGKYKKAVETAKEQLPKEKS